MSLRAFFAILLCKALRGISRLLHRGGTAMPGRYALKLCPDLLSILAKDVQVVAVTGTNGKTTSSRIIEQAFEAAGLSWFSNRSGANLISGITTEFVMNSSLSGRCGKEYAVIECDEAAAVKVFPQLKPRVIVVTNLFRDQLDRYGEVTHTLANIREAVKSVPDAVLCLNADCSLTSSLALELENRCVFYGINGEAAAQGRKTELSDASHCIRCKHEYEYDYITYGHLGGFRCPNCGYSRRLPDYAVTDIPKLGTESSEAVISVRGEKKSALIALPAMYNIYNAVGAVAAVCEAGIDADTAIAALGRFECGFGRMENFSLGAGGTKMMLVKNPTGCSQVIDFLHNIGGRFVLVICLNDRGADGTDISWIWDADFERLRDMAGRIEKIIVSGDRAEDMAVRIKYAGIAPESIGIERDYGRMVESIASQELPVYIMPTYTAMLELREAVIRRCGGREFWD